MRVSLGKKRLRIILLSLASLGICGALSYYILLNVILPLSGMFGNGCPAIFPTRIEREGRFHLPPSAHNLQSFCMGMQGWTAEARFDMDAADLPVLLDSTAIILPLSTSGAPKEWIHDSSSPIKTYLYGEAKYGWQRLFIDTTHPDIYRVYFIAMGGH